MYTPESSSCSDIIVNDEVVELNVTLLLQVLVMIWPPGNIITMIWLLNIHAPVVIGSWLKSVTLFPTGNGFIEA